MSTTLDILKNYVSEQLLDIYKESIRLCHLCNQDQIEEVITQSLERLGEDNTIDIISSIYSSVSNLIRETIVSHDIRINQDATLEDLNVILGVLLEIPYYMDKESINRVLESDISNEEKFATLGEYLSEYSLDQFMPLIEDVPKSFLDQVLSVVGEVNSVERIDYPQIVLRLKHYLEFTQTKDFLGSVLIYNDIVIGMPFERYIAYFAPSLDNWNYEQAAREILYILYLSRDGFDKPAEVFDKYVDTMFHDLQIQNRTKVALLTLISNFTVYLSSAQAVNFNQQLQESN